MNSQQQLSFYIPRISTKYEKKDVKTIFSELNIGKVKRVDFTPINKKQGFMEQNNNSPMNSAFVHMKSIDSNPFTQSIFKKLYVDSEGFKIYPENDNNYYWLLLKNNNPIEDTLMNKHQIVENCRFLEHKIEEQADIIKNLENKLAGVQNVVEQLVGGLYSHTTQTESISIHRNELHRTDYSRQFKNYRKNTNRWDHYPTTRQGDSNEKRIEYLEKLSEKTGKLLFELTGEQLEAEAALEEQLDDELNELKSKKNIQTKNNYQNNYDNDNNEIQYDYEYDNDNDEIQYDYDSDINLDDNNNTIVSYSTHSSMPPLLNMSDLDSISNNSYSSFQIERRRISSEICSNE